MTITFWLLPYTVIQHVYTTTTIRLERLFNSPDHSDNSFFRSHIIFHTSILYSTLLVPIYHAINNAKYTVVLNANDGRNFIFLELEFSFISIPSYKCIYALYYIYFKNSENKHAYIKLSKFAVHIILDVLISVGKL